MLLPPADRWAGYLYDLSIPQATWDDLVRTDCWPDRTALGRYRNFYELWPTELRNTLRARQPEARV